MRHLLFGALIAAAAPASASAAPVVLDAAAARAIVDGCAAHARAKQQSHAIVVVDSGGGEIAGLRMDGNRAGMMAFARAKAEAVAAWGFATSGMAEGAKDTPGFAFAPGVVTVAGGVPIFSADGKVLLGAAGASGEAPSDDEACAAAGITGAGFRTARAR